MRGQGQAYRRMYSVRKGPWLSSLPNCLSSFISKQVFLWVVPSSTKMCVVFSGPLGRGCGNVDAIFVGEE